ncbi:MAG TPA: type II toxin-antitoxin system Phd/YefM family antitoxin [Selenomonas sp.]|nr:type II toxin-antitoxin system Phd/YefM family antitoxin [Selenomonas sp.]
MEAVPSGSFLKEFTLLADRAVDEKERFLIQRKNGKNVILLSMDDYNEMLKEIYKNKK